MRIGYKFCKVVLAARKCGQGVPIFGFSRVGSVNFPPSLWQKFSVNATIE